MGISRDLMSGRDRSLPPIVTAAEEAAHKKDIQEGKERLDASLHRQQSRRAGSPPRESASSKPVFLGSEFLGSCIGRFCRRRNTPKKIQGGGTKRHTGKLPPPSISDKVVIIRNKLGIHAENLLKKAKDFSKQAERSEFDARAAHPKDAASRGIHTRRAHATHSMANEVIKERMDALDAREAIDRAIDMAKYAAKHPADKIAAMNAEEALANARALWKAVFGKVSMHVIAEEKAVEDENAEAASVYARRLEEQRVRHAKYAARVAARGPSKRLLDPVEEFRGHSVLGGGRRRTNRRTHKKSRKLKRRHTRSAY